MSGAPQRGAPRARSPRKRSGPTGASVLVGLLLIVVGVVITAATYSNAVDNGGGRYFVAYGPIVVGVVIMFRGFKSG